MKILQATTARGWSGGTEQCLLLAKYMNKLGYETDVLTWRGCELDRRAEKLGIDRVYFPNRKKFSLKEAKELARILENYDVVNTHISKAHWFIWLASFFTKRRPKVVYTRRVPYSLSKVSLLTKYNFHTNTVVSVSPEIFKNLQKVPFIKQKLYFIPSGVEIDRFNSNVESHIREELKLTKEAIVITNVANFSEIKGQHILIPVFKKLVNKYKGRSIYLLLVGRDTQSEQALSMAKQYGVEKRVISLGFRRDLPQVLKASDLFVFPSLNEGIAGSLLQAMAMRKIVVASYIGGIKSYLKHMENGIAVKPGSVESLYQGLITGLENLNNEGMKQRARETAIRYDIRTVTEKTVKLYKELLR